MYIHLRYLDVGGFREEVVLFDRDDVKVSDVLHKKRHLITKYVTVKLYNEYEQE